MIHLALSTHTRNFHPFDSAHAGRTHNKALPVKAGRALFQNINPFGFIFYPIPTYLGIVGVRVILLPMQYAVAMESFSPC